jgi:hypothetical protein
MKGHYVVIAGVFIEDESLVVSCGHEHRRLDQAFRCSVELGRMGKVSLVRAVNSSGGKPVDLCPDDREVVRRLAQGLSIVRRDCDAFTLLVFT